MGTIGKVLVYYREIPFALEQYVSRDGNIKLIKDGLHRGVGHACPRLTLIVEPVNNASQNKRRLAQLDRLLTLLLSNNQIVSFSWSVDRTLT